MSDRTDTLIEAAVACREAGMTAGDVNAVVADVFAAPWSPVLNSPTDQVKKKTPRGEQAARRFRSGQLANTCPRSTSERVP